MPFCSAAESQQMSAARQVKADNQVVDSDQAALPPLAFHLTSWLSLGAALKLTLAAGDNVDVVGLAPARQRSSESLLTTTAALAITPDVGVFIAAELLHSDKTERESVTERKISTAYIVWDQIMSLPLTLQIGRQRFSDERQWLFDENLDGAALQLKLGRLESELSGSSHLNPNSDKEALDNYLLRSDFHFTSQDRLGMYLFYRNDPINEKSDRQYLGLSGETRFSGHKLWLEAASLSGDNGSRQRQGFAVDTGVTLRFGANRRWSVTLAHAVGSGDGNSSDNRDQTFRQTGLDDNEARFNGITKFKYYGVVSDPELSNLQVSTVGVGLSEKRRYSIDLVYHAYEQRVANSRFRSKVIQSPTGKERALGSELDLILGLRAGRYLSAYGTVGVFNPGAAFERGDSVLFAEVQLKLSAAPSSAPAKPATSVNEPFQRTPIRAYPPPPID